MNDRWGFAGFMSYWIALSSLGLFVDLPFVRVLDGCCWGLGLVLLARALWVNRRTRDWEDRREAF